MNIFQPLEQSLAISWVLQSALVAAGLLIAAGLLLRRQLADPSAILPDEGFTLRNALEVLVDALAGLAESIIGPDYRRYFPLVGTMFFFILVGNLMGLVPALAGATTNVNTAAAWAVISFLVYNAVGIQKHGWKYIYQFMGPAIFHFHVGGRVFHVRALAVIFLPLEVVLHLARMLTLTVRLIANMFADHTVVAVWIGMVPIAVPAVFMGLGLMVAFLQAFVFALLTMIYIGLALEEAH
jgi:F-type H+-transporting ATPase subunit a